MTDLRNVYQKFWNSVYRLSLLSLGCCLLTPADVATWNIYQKIWDIISIVSNVVSDFFLLSSVFLGQFGKTALCLKKRSQKWRHFYRMCLSSIHTFWYINMPYMTAGYGIFFYFNIFDDNSYLNCCISTKLSMTVCLMNTHVFIYRLAVMLILLSFFRLCMTINVWNIHKWRFWYIQ